MADVDVGGIAGVECKHQDKPNVWAALTQAEESKTETNVVAAWCRRNGGEELVCMRPETWLKIFHAYLVLGSKTMCPHQQDLCSVCDREDEDDAD